MSRSAHVFSWEWEQLGSPFLPGLPKVFSQHLLGEHIPSVNSHLLLPLLLKLLLLSDINGNRASRSRDRTRKTPQNCLIALHRQAGVWGEGRGVGREVRINFLLWKGFSSNRVHTEKRDDSVYRFFMLDLNFPKLCLCHCKRLGRSSWSASLFSRWETQEQRS